MPEELLKFDIQPTEAQEDEQPKLGLKSLFANWTVTRMSLAMFVNWIASSLGYYGISLGIGDIGSDVFLNFILVTA